MAGKNQPKSGGRRRGTPNKRTAELLELLKKQYPKYNPVLQMAEIAQDEEVEMSLRIQCAKEVAQYLFPKRKAVELSQGTGEPFSFTMEVLGGG